MGDAACKATDTCCDSYKCKGEDAADITGTAEGKCNKADCVAKDAKCTKDSTCCSGGKCKTSAGADVTGTEEGTCKITSRRRRSAMFGLNRTRKESSMKA